MKEVRALPPLFPLRHPMKLFLVRHADAVTAEENPARPLSARGREDVQRLAAFFHVNRALATATAVWHSPLARAVETAAILFKTPGFTARLMEIPGLEPDDDPCATAGRLAQVTDDLVIVGHEPHLGALATLLVDGGSAASFFALRKGAVLALKSMERIPGKPGRWRLYWHFSPELLPPGEQL